MPTKKAPPETANRETAPGPQFPTQKYARAIDACDEIAGRLVVASFLMQKVAEGVLQNEGGWSLVVVEEIVSECVDLAEAGANAEA